MLWFQGLIASPLVVVGSPLYSTTTLQNIVREIVTTSITAAI